MLTDGPYWHLQRVQTALRHHELTWQLTSSAAIDCYRELGFDEDTLDQFIQALGPEYVQPRSSQWCLEPAITLLTDGKDRRVPSLADVYLMAFNRMCGRAVPCGHPRIYFKFAVEGHLLIVYSLHYERL